jgi:protein SCO1/2
MRWLSGAAAGVILAVGVGVVVYSVSPRRPPAAAHVATPVGPASSELGGPFALIDQDGKPTTDRAFLGKPTVFYFGFTYCPEICPTTLSRLAAWMKALGPNADKLNVVFISIDPERDTPRRLKAYLSGFDPRFRGLTGSPDAVAAAARQFDVFYNKVPLPDGDYTVDHSTSLYLMDAQGHFVEPIGYDEESKMAIDSLKALVGASPAA